MDLWSCWISGIRVGWLNGEEGGMWGMIWVKGRGGVVRSLG